MTGWWLCCDETFQSNWLVNNVLLIQTRAQGWTRWNQSRTTNPNTFTTLESAKLKQVNSSSSDNLSGKLHLRKHSSFILRHHWPGSRGSFSHLNSLTPVPHWAWFIFSGLLSLGYMSGMRGSFRHMQYCTTPPLSAHLRGCHFLWRPLLHF